jgi:hypothetical protein
MTTPGARQHPRTGHTTTSGRGCSIASSGMSATLTPAATNALPTVTSRTRGATVTVTVSRRR